MNQDWLRVFNEERLLRDMAKVKFQGGLEIPELKKEISKQVLITLACGIGWGLMITLFIKAVF